MKKSKSGGDERRFASFWLAVLVERARCLRQNSVCRTGHADQILRNFEVERGVRQFYPPEFAPATPSPDPSK